MAHVVSTEISTARDRSSLRFRLAILECYFKRKMVVTEIALLTSMSHHAINKIINEELDNIQEAKALSELPITVWRNYRMDLQELLVLVCKTFSEDHQKMGRKNPGSKSKPAFCHIAQDLGYKRKDFAPIIGMINTRHVSHHLERSEDYMEMDRFYAANFPILLEHARKWKDGKSHGNSLL